MYYTGLDPATMDKVYTPVSHHEKAMQRALIQYRNPENYELVKEALIKNGRTDLIGFGPKCLIPPRNINTHNGRYVKMSQKNSHRLNSMRSIITQKKTRLLVKRKEGINNE